MKLFTKISLIVAAIAAGLGILGVFVGLTMGANFNDLSEMGIYVTPHREVVVNGVIVNELEEDIEEYIENKVEGRTENSMHHNSVTEHGHHTIENLHNENLHSHSCSLQDIENLKIDVQNAEIKIFAVEEAVNFNYFSNTSNDISKKDGSTLKLVDNNTMGDKVELELFIPIGILKEIEIDAAAGAIVADKIVADNISIEIKTASVQVDELIVTEEAELQMNAGEMIIGYFDGPKLDLECDMGAIMVVCSGNEKDYNYNLECNMGNVQINQETYSGVGENIRVNNGGEKSIKAECAMGEIRLEFPNNL